MHTKGIDDVTFQQERKTAYNLSISNEPKLEPKLKQILKPKSKLRGHRNHSAPEITVSILYYCAQHPNRSRTRIQQACTDTKQEYNRVCGEITRLSQLGLLEETTTHEMVRDKLMINKLINITDKGRNVLNWPYLHDFSES